MTDGLYRVEYGSICAGFVVEGGKVTMIAPILRKRLSFWKKIAVRVGRMHAEQIGIEEG